MIMKKLLNALLIAILPATAATAQVATDACGYNAGNQYNVCENSCQLQPFNIPSSYVHNYNPNVCSSGFNKDAFGWFTATQTNTVIRYVPETGRPLIVIFTGACNALTVVGCNASPAAGVPAQVVLTTVIGQNYMIRAQNLQVNGVMSGSICVYNPPANDSCVNSEELLVNDTCNYMTYTSIGATNGGITPLPTCGAYSSTSAMDIWFHFYAPDNGIVEINTSAGTLTDAVMQLYRNGCGGLTLVECNDDSGPGLMPRIDRNCSPLVPNSLYTIRLWGKTGTTGSFDICVMSKAAFQNPQNDCSGAYTICDDQAINNATENKGCTQDLSSTNRGCLISNERQGLWYFFSPSSPGTIEFTITPVDALGNPVATDYDFAIWASGNQITCPPTSTPIRCSYASAVNSGSNTGAGTYLTGLKSGELDTSEPAFNGVNGFVQPLVIPSAHVGKNFILYVDNFDTNNQGFKLEWNLTGGASLDCAVLPVELVGLEAVAGIDMVGLEWITVSENNSDRFIIERSSNANEFTPIGDVPAAGTSHERIQYEWTDAEPIDGIAYYRLQQVDNDGGKVYSNVVSATIRSGRPGVLVVPNPATANATLQLQQAGYYEITIIDGCGRTVSTLSREFEADRPIEIQLGELEAGSYLIKCTSTEGNTSIGRFVKN